MHAGSDHHDGCMRNPVYQYSYMTLNSAIGLFLGGRNSVEYLQSSTLGGDSLMCMAAHRLACLGLRAMLA